MSQRLNSRHVDFLKLIHVLDDLADLPSEQLDLLIRQIQASQIRDFASERFVYLWHPRTVRNAYEISSIRKLAT